jgi:hypothetical protein
MVAFAPAFPLAPKARPEKTKKRKKEKKKGVLASGTVLDQLQHGHHGA